MTEHPGTEPRTEDAYAESAAEAAFSPSPSLSDPWTEAGRALHERILRGWQLDYGRSIAEVEAEAAALARSGDPQKLNAALEKAWAERPDLRIGPIEHALSGAPLVHAESLPERVVVGANGAYWRDFGTHYSMCPVSTDNDPVVPLAVYVHAEEDRTGGLDAAWAAAEAALPDGWRIEQVRRSPFDFWKWLAYANGRHESDIATGSGLTPAAALRGLAAALSATPTDEAERE